MRLLMKYTAGMLVILALPLLVLAQSQPNNGSVFPVVITPTVTPEGFIGLPSSRMPTNGLWVAEAFEFQTTGACVADWGDNDGPPVGYDPFDQEGEPVCAFADVPYIIAGNARQEYVTGSDSMYAAMDEIEGRLIHDGGGAATGSVVTRTRRTYQVLAPDLIRVTITIEEEGGCTMTASYNLMLKTPDEMVCETQNFNEQVFLPISTPTPTPTPDPTAGDPLYLVTEPFENDMTVCTEANMVPQFTEATIRFNSPLEMVIDWGEGEVTLYLAGDDYYEYDSGTGSTREHITMFPVDNGWSLGWSKRVDSDNCRWDVMLVLPGDVTDEITPEAQPTTDSSTSGPALVEIAEGVYGMEWMDEYMASLCTDDLKAQAPDFASARISLSPDDGDATITYEEGEFVLDYMADQQMYMVMEMPYGDDTMFISLAAYDDGTAYLTYQVTFASGETCLRSAQMVGK
jgi:hypothetical protein